MPSRHRHFQIVIGRTDRKGLMPGSWLFEGWHLYRMNETHSKANRGNTWRVWRKVF